MQSRGWSLEYVGGMPTTSIWYWSRLRFRLARRNSTKAGVGRFGPKEWAVSRTTPELMAAARKNKADIYIGHNLGALPAVVAGARENNGRAFFDLEDVYADMSPEGDAWKSREEWLRSIEDTYIPLCDELMAASDGIGAIYRDRYAVNPITILNVFPREWGTRGASRKAGEPLRLFWFSQTIGPDRGLQDVIAAMARMKQHAIELHLLGRWQDGFEQGFFAKVRSQGLDVERQIRVYPPISPDEIPRFAAGFDVGLALEMPLSKNKNVCLSNKIFTYLLAGNAIIATETEGQKSFIDKLPEVGFTYPPGDIDKLTEKLEMLASNRELLARLSEGARAQARARYNWNVESRKLLELASGTGSERHEAA